MLDILVLTFGVKLCKVYEIRGLRSSRSDQVSCHQWYGPYHVAFRWIILEQGNSYYTKTSFCILSEKY